MESIKANTSMASLSYCYSFYRIASRHIMSLDGGALQLHVWEPLQDSLHQLDSQCAVHGFHPDSGGGVPIGAAEKV